MTGILPDTDFETEDTIVSLLPTSDRWQSDGWVFVNEDDTSHVKRDLFANDEYIVDCTIYEQDNILFFSTQIYINSDSGLLKPDRAGDVLNVLLELIDHGPYVQSVRFGGCESHGASFYFTYPWLIPTLVRESLPPEAIGNFCSDYAKTVTAPALALAPVIALYLRGVMKNENDFHEGVSETLEFMATPAEGNA